MNTRAAGDRASVRDWVDTSFDTAVQDQGPSVWSVQDVRPEKRSSMHESTLDLKAGCVVDELDTIPAELLDLFK